MKIYVVKGIDFASPIRPMECHATKASADTAAAVLVNDLLEWVELPKDATASNWEERLLAARMKRCDDFDIEVDENSLDEDPIGEALGEYNGDVWIEVTELHGIGLMDWQAAQGVADEAGEAPIDRRVWKTEIDISNGYIDVSVRNPDGGEFQPRSVFIELSNGALVAHCYDGAHENPLSVRVRADKISTDTDADDVGYITHR